MASDATIRRVARPRGELEQHQAVRLIRLRRAVERAEDEYRAGVVQTLAAGGSFSCVSEVTGLSTNTLQRWKREASA